MEGYTNVISSPEDFDDLNIERRESRNESNIVEDRVKNSKHEEIFYEQLKVKLGDGSYGFVFSKSFSANNVAQWHCNICDVSVFTCDLDFHLERKKHQDRCVFSTPPPNLFPRMVKSADALEDDMPKLAPGEPVPPGFEEKFHTVSQIQATLDSYKSDPLIGLEFLVEIVDDSSPECKYVCMLCDKRGDPRVILKHLTSYHHYSKYMGLYFPTVSRMLALEFPRTKLGRKTMAIALTRICGVLEQKFGRLKPISVDKFDFPNKRGMLFNKILSDSHIRESPDTAFMDDIKKIINEEKESEKNSSGLTYLQSDPSQEASQHTNSTFIKGRITCDRSRLRTRDTESNGFKDMDGQGAKRKLPFEINSAECGKVLEDKDGNGFSGISNEQTKLRHGSVSPISTLSFSSDILSRSPSRSRSPLSPTRSRFYRDRSGSPPTSLYSRLTRPRIDNRVYQPRRYNQRLSRSRSKSQPRSRSRRSRSKSISQLRGSTSKSISRPRRSNSKSDSRTMSSNSKSISRSRRSNSKTRLRSRRSNSKTKSRSRRSNSKTKSQSRKSRSRSRSRRSNSKTKSQSRRSNSKTTLQSRKSRSRSRSRRSTSRSKRSSSRSRLPARQSNLWHNPRSRSRSPLRTHNRNEKSRSPSNSKKSPQTDDVDICRERNKWDLFRREFRRTENESEKQLKFHEKNPEKHPSYPDEWKKFWNRRYKELQADGKDPEKHDFKPEWIEFWNKRMHIIYEEELKAKKDEIRKRFKLPDDLPASEPLFNQGNKRKNRTDEDLSALSSEPSLSEKADKRSENERNKDGIRSKRPLSPWEESKASDRTYRSSSPLQTRWNDKNLRGGFSSHGRGNPVKSIRLAQSDEPEMLSVLRLLTALENQLGSLGPKVNNLMAKAIALEKKSPKSSDVLLNDSENIVLFETVKEKLRGQLIAGIVGRHMVAATRACLDHLASLLEKVDQIVVPSNEVSLAVSTPLTDSPVVVPGIGTMDKVAIAQQIASALVAQGKTDVTQEELEQLINAVVGMAHTTAHMQPVSAAQLISNMKDAPSSNTNVGSLDGEKQTPLQQLMSVVNPTHTLSINLAGNKNDNVSGLALLQSAYEEARISPASRNFMKDTNNDIVSGKSAVKYNPRSEQDMSYLSEDELKSLLQNFKDLSTSEQQHLITYLKKIEETEPARVEKLRKFVNIGSPISSFPISGKESTVKNSTSQSVNRRLSPFSLRFGGSNPSVEEQVPVTESKGKKNGDSDSDDDYSFEDIYAAASKKVKEREKAKEEEEKLKAAKEKPNTKISATPYSSKTSDDPAIILKETKAMIANLMGQLPGKFIQKQQTNVSSPKKEPILANNSSVGNRLNAPVMTEPSQNFATVPNILSVSSVPPPNISDTVVGQQYPQQDPATPYQDSYSNQYSEQLYVPQDTSCSQYSASYGNTYDSGYYNQYQQSYTNQGISSQNMYADHVYPDQSHQNMYAQQDVYQVSSQPEPYRHQQQSYENQDPYQYGSQRQTYY